jgi:hypothetical protein
LEEKHELQELNKRFELYILKMRERDDAASSQGGSQRLIDEMRARANTEMEALRTLTNQQLNDIRAQRDASLVKVAELEEKLKRYAFRVRNSACLFSCG